MVKATDFVLQQKQKQIEFLEKFKNLKVKIFTKSRKFYQGLLIDVFFDGINLLDRKLGNLFLSMEEIEQISEVKQ